MRIIRVVNMIPRSMSGETAQDSEPQLAVKPQNPLHMAATAFTPVQPRSTGGPLYVSFDGGQTWGVRSTMPGGRPFDQSVRFADSGLLYAGILSGNVVPNPLGQLAILRTAVRPLSFGQTVTSLVTRSSVDQPYVSALTVAGKDKVYVGNNDSYRASVDHSARAETASPAGFSEDRIDSRQVGGNAPSIRTAPHPSGTVYAAYLSLRKPIKGPYPDAYVVVARDDNFATASSPFVDLVGSDGKAGVQVAVVTVPWTPPSFTYLGNQRVGSSLSIAVDPRDRATALVAWGDGPTREATQTLRVRWTGNEGHAWSNDILTIPNATNPALAITSDGRAGLLYQQLVSKRFLTRRVLYWETHLSVTKNWWSGASEDILLASTLDTPRFGDPYIGDYADLIAVGRDFYGVFSADNTPNLANFPNGVRYQRNCDFNRRILYAVDNRTVVSSSVDPFFFHASWIE